MKKILFFLLVSISIFGQHYKVEIGSNITSYEYEKSAGVNSPTLRPSAGMHASLSTEIEAKPISKYLVVESGINYNQFNNVGDIQNIPIVYSTDYIGIVSGIGPKVNLGSGYLLEAKFDVSINKMINGYQYLSNHYVDLAGDDQFNSFLFMKGYSIEFTKQIGQQLGVYIKYQRLDSYPNGSPSLNIIPSTFSIGLTLNK